MKRRINTSIIFLHKSISEVVCVICVLITIKLMLWFRMDIAAFQLLGSWHRVIFFTIQHEFKTMEYDEHYCHLSYDMLPALEVYQWKQDTKTFHFNARIRFPGRPMYRHVKCFISLMPILLPEQGSGQIIMRFTAVNIYDVIQGTR